MHDKKKDDVSDEGKLQFHHSPPTDIKLQTPISNYLFGELGEILHNHNE